MKFIHMADMHLGSMFSRLDEKRAKERRAEHRSVFDKIIDIVKTEKADALLIAGDLFDTSDALEDAKYVCCKFQEIAGVSVLIAAGNHDWAIYPKIKWGKNVHIFSVELERVCVRGIDIYGASFSGMVQEETLLSDIQPAGRPSILVMHGEIGSGECNPMEMERLLRFNYCALGHIHKYQGIIRQGTCTYAYAGFPEPRGFDENGEGGIIIGDIDEEAVCAERVITSVHSYLEETVDISECEDNIDVVDLLRGRIDAKGTYKFCVRGYKNNFDLSAAYIISCLENFCFDLQIDVEEKMDYERIGRENTLRGAFVRGVMEREGLSYKQREYIMRIGLQAMEKGGGN